MLGSEKMSKLNNKRVIFDPVYYTDVVDQTEMVFTHTQLRM